MTSEELLKLAADPYASREQIQAAIQTVMHPQSSPALVPRPEPETPAPVVKLQQKTHIDGTTPGGFPFSLSVEALNDMELLDMLTEADEKPQLLGRILERLLGEDQKKTLYAFLRDPATGRVPVERVSQAVIEIFQTAGNPGKNS